MQVTHKDDIFTALYEATGYLDRKHVQAHKRYALVTDGRICITDGGILFRILAPGWEDGVYILTARTKSTIEMFATPQVSPEEFPDIAGAFESVTADPAPIAVDIIRGAEWFYLKVVRRTDRPLNFRNIESVFKCLEEQDTYIQFDPSTPAGLTVFTGPGIEIATMPMRGDDNA